MMIIKTLPNSKITSLVSLFPIAFLLIARERGKCEAHTNLLSLKIQSFQVQNVPSGCFAQIRFIKLLLFCLIFFLLCSIAVRHSEGMRVRNITSAMR